MTAVLLTVSWLIAAAALLLATATLVVFRRPATALAVLLDLLLAAGLLRLSVDATWTAIGLAAAVILLRRLLVRGLHRGALTVGQRAVG